MEETTDCVLSNYSYAEEDLIANINSQLKIIVSSIPANTNVSVKSKERAAVKEAAIRMHAAANQIFGLVLELRQQVKTLTKYEGLSSLGTYAEVTKRQRTPISNTTKLIAKKSAALAGIKNPKNMNHEIIVSAIKNPDEPVPTPEETLELLRSHVDPKQLGIKIKTIRPLSEGDIKIQVLEDKDLQVLKHAVQKEDALTDKIKLVEKGKKSPKIILYNVPTDSEEQDLLKDIYNQNTKLQEGISEQEFLESTKISHSFHPKGGNHRTHTVLSVRPDIRNKFMQQGRIYLGWCSIVIDDYIDITRCYNCTGFGHTSYRCTERQRCTHCTKKHKFKECPNLEKDPICSNCKKHNKTVPENKALPTDHNAFDKGCPLLQRYKAYQIRTINYE
ncbi:uncharacterized protein [Centruroides vittatus]|uniref:uncharacterized protein n=1 Tax=Centruroides vittatus TaxID=120091 RepID=UPI00350EA6F0